MKFRFRPSFNIPALAALVASLLGSAPIFTPAHASGGVIRYATPSGMNTGTCTSWGTACELQYAISVAVSGDEVWAHQGTYMPDNSLPSDRTLSFALKNGVEIYGGFAGAETLREQRSPLATVTILSGAVGDPGQTADDSYHVVTGSGTNSTAILDGFTVTAGNANGSSPADAGGGMYNLGGSPTITNVIFNANSAAYGGGGMQNSNFSSPVLTKVVFMMNTAPSGGGMYNSGLSLPTLTDAVFGNNIATGVYGGGGMFNDGGSDAILNGVTFSGNTAAGNRGGAMVNQDGSNPSVTNVTFYLNFADNGAAVYNADAWPTFTNVTFSGNHAANAGSAMYNDTGAIATILNSVLWGDFSDEIVNAGTGTSTINDSVVQGGCPSLGSTCNGNVLNFDPMLGALADNGGFTQTMALLAASSAIDSGSTGSCASSDQRGVTRPRGAGCDMGAYERIPPFTDFDHDDITDPAKFVPSTGVAWWFESDTSVWDGMYLGSDVAEYVGRSDFDGDAITDPAKYVSSNQTMWYFQSSDSTWQGAYLGTGTYSMLPGSDFDGDQKTDPAKYDTLGTVWRLLSGTSTWAGTFVGTDAAPALPGSDYDGDGKTDVAKYVAAGAIWYLGSSDSTWHGMYIGSDGAPVPASDFDGDGITDMAKYLTGSNTLWYLASSTSSWVGLYLGPGTFTYVPAADFDGDGKTDPAKFDIGSKVLWYLQSTTSTWQGVWMGPETYDVVN